MAKCDFSIDFTDTADSLIGKASEAINNAGGIFDGDSGNGNFSIPTPLGKITGNYIISDQNISFSISDKPFLVSCSRIENELRKYIV